MPTFVTILALLIGFVIGVAIGYLSMKLFFIEKKCSSAISDVWFRMPAIENQTFIDSVFDEVSADNIHSNLRILASKPHLAGLERDEELVQYIKHRWIQEGLDEVETTPYTVLLSYPNPQTPNKVNLINEYGFILHETSHMEDVLVSEDSDPNFVHAFNAYSPSGTVTGDIVYVNYGAVEDFLSLEQLGINVTGKICLARHGQIFRGNKVVNAEERGAIGVILYSDPSDVASDGLHPEDVYPNTVMLPSSGIQRGALFTDIGDPLTPHWPSIDGAHRISPADALLPTIPCQPISYKDAEVFLKILGGEKAPNGWSGFSDLPHNIGPGFGGNNRNISVRLEVHNVLKTVTVHNVVGKLFGALEPDRYVIQGNHRDAWGFGAVDPSSGTAQLIENVRVFGKLAKNGWRPRRTLIFCSWAAEEYGVIGSQEWVEEHVNMLMNRAVGYINTDVCVSGPNLEISASPLLNSMVIRATKMVRAPNEKHLSLYDNWKNTFRNGTEDDNMIFGVGAGSDLAPFMFYAGVPVADIWFRIDQQKNKVSIYPPYHTGYDTLHLMEKLIDPDFSIHRTCSQLALVMLLDMADSIILPLEPRDLAKSMINIVNDLKTDNTVKQLEKYGATGSHLIEAIENFVTIANKWQEHVQHANLSDVLNVRSINDQLMQLERSLILPNGLPGRPNTRHALFSPSMFDAYASSAFPGIFDLLYSLSKPDISDDDSKNLKEELKKHITAVMLQVLQAASMLKTV